MKREIKKLAEKLGIKVEYFDATGYYDAAISTAYGYVRVFQEETHDELIEVVLGWLQNNKDYVRALVELHTLLTAKGLYYGIIHYNKKNYPPDETLVYGEIYSDEDRENVVRRVGAFESPIPLSAIEFLIYELIKTVKAL